MQSLVCCDTLLMILDERQHKRLYVNSCSQVELQNISQSIVSFLMFNLELQAVLHHVSHVTKNICAGIYQQTEPSHNCIAVSYLEGQHHIVFTSL